jgi:hypothetical protein
MMTIQILNECNQIFKVIKGPRKRYIYLRGSNRDKSKKLKMNFIGSSINLNILLWMRRFLFKIKKVNHFYKLA